MRTSTRARTSGRRPSTLPLARATQPPPRRSWLVAPTRARRRASVRRLSSLPSATRPASGERAVASLLEGLLLELEEEAVASGSACGHDVADGSR